MISPDDHLVRIIARSRGWSEVDERVYDNAVHDEDWNTVCLVHPFDWLTEDEVEGNVPLVAPVGVI